jgi:DNA-binding NarL/FixJ family response regulator
MTIQILVADDHPDVRGLLIRMIDRAGDMQVVAEAADGVEVLERYGRQHTDLVLLDLTMPRKTGIETLRELLALHSEARVLVVSMHPPEQLAERLIRAGAKGYLGKDRVAEHLLDAIRAVHAGGIYFPGARPAPRPEAEPESRGAGSPSADDSPPAG